MRKSRFTEEQMIAALKEHAAGTPAKELCRRLGVGVETLYRWKQKYGGMEVSEARRLRALEDENRLLKNLVAGQRGPQGRALKKLVTPAERRPAVDYLKAEWPGRASRLRAGNSWPLDGPVQGEAERGPGAERAAAGAGLGEAAVRLPAIARHA